MRGRARTRGRFTMADDFEDDIVHFSVDDLAVKGFGVMEEIRRQGKLCDVTLRVGEHKYSAHRVVLAASIPYFHAMFTTDMAESKREEIVMQGTDPRLHPKNVLGVRSFAEAMMCPALYDTANSFLQQHFVEASSGEEFLGLPGEELLELAARDELHVEGEEQVFEAVLAWVRRDREGRAPLLPDLLTCVRLPLCRPHFLTDRVQQDELIRACHKCRDLLDEAKDYHLMPDRRPVLPAYKTRPRCCTSLAGRVYAVGGLNSAGRFNSGRRLRVEHGYGVGG